MKKFFLYAAAMMMLAASCQRQELDPVADGDTQVTFTVNTGELATRAIADGTNVDVLYWEIYGDLTKDALGEGVVRDADGDKTFTVNLRLLADQNYNIIFWAQVDGQNHYVVDDLRSVGIKTYDDEKANDETRAAFFALHPFSTENGKKVEETVTLYRPFAQINLGATTLETSLNLVDEGKIKVTSTQITVNRVATSFNTVLGYGEGAQAVTFTHAATPNGNDADCKDKLLEVNDNFYHWLGMNYLIVNGNEKDNVVVDIEVKTNMGDVLHKLPVVPVKENYRTNILGDLLTTGAEFTVVVDEDFQEPDYIVPTPENFYTIASVADLEWLQQQVNKEGNDFRGKTVRLAADIDLQGAEWTPIEGFEGTFDGSKLTKAAGDNYTISNFTVNVAKLGGLFGSVNGTLKNVNVENVTVTSGHYAGALAGYVYGRVENCHATNVTVTAVPVLNAEGKYDDGNHAGGLVGYLPGEPHSYLVGCSVTNAVVTAYRDLGAVLGCAVGTVTISDNAATDCQVIVDRVLDAPYVEEKAENAGEIVGRYAGTVDASNVAENVVIKTTQTPAEGGKTLAELVKETGAVIELPAGEYKFPSGFGAGVTINCAEGTVFTGNSKLNINGSTVVGATFSNPSGSAVDQTINGTFVNCTFKGSNALRNCYAGKTVVFENCVFDGDVYGVHFDGGANEVLFKNCVISGFNATAAAVKLVTFDGCTFKALGNSGYNGINLWGSAKMIDTEFTFDGSVSNEWIDAIGEDKTYEFTGCTINGGSILTGEYLFSRNDATDITIDGVLYEDFSTITFITTAAEMVAFANEVNVNKKSFSGKTVYLASDIDLAGIDWEPVGQTGATTFNGVFDGQNHTISNLNVDSEAETGTYYSSGLFGWVETHSAGCGQIKNVKINGAVVKGHHNCGALVGYITEKYALVENCHVTGAEISCTYANDDADGDKAGALIGNATVSTVVKGCTATNSTVSAGRDAGQLIGAGREANVTDCSATQVAVEANGTGSGANVRNEVIGRLL